MKGEPVNCFKQCPKCGMQWLARSDLLEDPEVRLLGFQPGANGHKSGFFLFCHERCGTSLALQLRLFEDLGEMPVVTRSGCSIGLQVEFCLVAKNNRPCPSECVCAFVSSVSRTIQSWPREAPE